MIDLKFPIDTVRLASNDRYRRYSGTLTDPWISSVARLFRPSFSDSMHVLSYYNRRRTLKTCEIFNFKTKFRPGRLCNGSQWDWPTQYSYIINEATNIFTRRYWTGSEGCSCYQASWVQTHQWQGTRVLSLSGFLQTQVRITSLSVIIVGGQLKIEFLIL